MKWIYNTSLLLSALLFCCSSCKQETKEIVFSDESIPVKLVSLKSLQTPAQISATGLVSTANEANYAFKIGGIITKIYASEGSSFKKGQLLATLNPTEINSGMEQSRLGVDKAKRDYVRAQNLYKDSVATLEQLQNAKTALDIAQKNLQGIAFNAEYAKIYANANGFVSKKLANEGEVIAPGVPVLAINEDSGTANWTVKLGLTDQEWAAVKVGQKADVTIDAFPGKQFHAMVYRKSKAADQGSGSLQVELNLQLGEYRLALGMFAKAIIKTARTMPLTPIPYEAIVEADGNNAFVYVPNGGDKVRRIPVVIGNFDGGRAFVKSGLEGISDIIVSNSAFLNENSSIKIIK